MIQHNSQIVSRRNFILTGISGVALTLGARITASGQTTVETFKSNAATVPIKELVAWISIDDAGNVTVMNHRSEMGQGTHQVFAQMVAEELEIKLDQVKVVFAPANPKKYGPQPQEGSFSVRGWYKQLLQAGAAAREMLIEAAARKWSVSIKECYAENGQVIHKATSRTIGYGSLVQEASLLTPPQNVILKSRKDYKVIGRPLARKDIPMKANGTAIFGMDFKIPGMLYAVVERNPRFRGKVKSFDDQAPRAIQGVKHVMKVQRAVFATTCEGVAVVADNLWSAMEGRKALRVVWDDEGFEHLDSQQLTKQMLGNLNLPPPSVAFDEAMKLAPKKFEAVYETPYQAHSCMEPLNCTVHVQANRIDVWGPIQEANWIQADLSSRMNIPIENVHVNMTFLGGGFGRKAFPDYPHEAALISKAMSAPVQVVWTREDDMIAGPFRPGAAYTCTGHLDDKGNIFGFQCITATQWIGQEWTHEPYDAPTAPSYNTGTIEGILPGYLETIPHFSLGGVPTRAPLPVMWWRSVSASTNGFAVESFIDELAHESSVDPLEFRRPHLRDPRYEALVDKLIEISHWKSRGKGWGVAITECFSGICAHAVQVNKEPSGQVRITKVIALMDCGMYFNPDIIRAQVEGSIVMALGAAIKHEIHFKDGKTVEKNFDTYKMPRITDIAEIEVHIMENEELPGGVGEPGLPPFAPALCNAIFDLTGKRIRKLPFNLKEV